MRVSNWKPQQFDGEIMTASMDRLEKAAEVVANEARRRVPVRSGKLKDTIRVVRLRDSDARNVRIYAGNRKKGGAYYAHIVERGSVKMRAKPFLRPALNASKKMIQSILRGGE